MAEFQFAAPWETGVATQPELPPTDDTITITQQPTTTPVDQQVVVQQERAIAPWETETGTHAQEVYDDYNWLEKKTADLGIDPGWAAGLIRRIGVETAGMVSGAAAGSQIVPSNPAARILGGAAGAVIGSELDQALGNTLEGDDRLINSIITASGGSLVGPAKISPRDARQIAKILERRGIRTTTPGIVSDSKLVQQIEQSLREIPFSGSNIDDAVRKIYDDFAAAVDHMSDDATLLFAAPSEAGEAIAKGAASKIEAMGNRSDELYDISKRLIGEQDVKVDPSRVIDFVNKVDGGWDNPIFAEFLGSELVENVGKGMATGPQTWKDMTKLLSKLGRLMKSHSGDELGDIKGLWKSLHNDMDAAIETLPAEATVARKAWYQARNYFKKAIVGRTEELRKIEQHANPAALFNALTGKGNYTSVWKAKTALGHHAPWASVQELVIRNMGQVIGAEGRSQFSTRQFLTNWKKINFDSRAAQALFGKKLPELKELARIAERLEGPSLRANVSKTGITNLMNLLLVGGGAAVGFGGDISAVATGALGGLIAPRALSKLWTSPVMMKWMLRGKDVAIDSHKAMSAWGKAFLKMSAAEGINETDALGIYNLIMAPFTEEGSDIPSVPTQ